MAKDVLDRPAKAVSTPLPALSPIDAERVSQIVREQVRLQVEAKMEQIARVTPRQIFSGDDALFLAFQAGFVAGAHVASPHDKNALEIFLRCRGVLDKLAPIAAPAAGGNAS